MKILECKRGQIYDIGFIDPYWVNEETVKTKAKETEDSIVKALRFHEKKSDERV